MTTKIERERKYLVKFPKSWSSLEQLMDHIVDIERIEQTYLKPEPGQQAARVRKTVQGLSGKTKTIYHYNKKKPTGETGAHQETEYEISEQQYDDYLHKANPSKCEIQKTRFVFKWHKQIFELDVFKGHLQGLAILEIELEKGSDQVELPDFLQVIKEVTKDKSYSNFSLADKDLKQ